MKTTAAKIEVVQGKPEVTKDNPTPGNMRDKSGKKYMIIPAVILFALLLTSLGCEIFLGSSMLAQVRLLCPQYKTLWKHMQPFIRGKGVLKVAETIGLSSILVAWIYAALDKTELGLRYSDLAKEDVPCYFLYVIVHFACVLVCVFLGTINMIESACISLLIILWSGYIQCRILLRVVLSSENRAKLAVLVWERRINEAIQVSLNELVLELLNIAGSITEELIDSTDELQEKLSNAMERIGSKAEASQAEIEDLGRIWARLLYDKASENQLVLVHNILKVSPSDFVGAGYALWALQKATRQSLNDGTDIETLLVNARATLRTAAYGTTYMPRVVGLWEKVICLLAWIFFLQGDIGINTSLMLPDKIADMTLDGRSMCELTCKAYLGGKFDAENFEVAWKQLEETHEPQSGR